jgi:putative FmdB family regulatory protein
MPIYEYKCSKCNHITEIWQKFSDPPIDQCEECGGKVKKIISQNTFHLKGSGWYVTDYGSKTSGDQKPKKKQNEKAKKEDKKSVSKKSSDSSTP